LFLITLGIIGTQGEFIRTNIAKEKTCWSSGRVDGVGVMTLDDYVSYSTKIHYHHLYIIVFRWT
jgi:hypothetical protein